MKQLPPRIEPIPIDSYNRLVATPAEPSPDGAAPPAINLTRTWAQHPSLFMAQRQIQEYFRKSTVLPRDEREFAILRIGWRCGCRYEFGQHTLRAQEAGLTPQQIALTTMSWPSLEDKLNVGIPGILIALADELYDRNDVSDGVWSALSAHYDLPQIIELICLVGRYWSVCALMNAARIQVEPDAPGFPGE